MCLPLFIGFVQVVATLDQFVHHVRGGRAGGLQPLGGAVLQRVTALSMFVTTCQSAVVPQAPANKGPCGAQDAMIARVDAALVIAGENLHCEARRDADCSAGVCALVAPLRHLRPGPERRVRPRQTWR